MALTAATLNNRSTEVKSSKWTDARLVRECLDGNQDAWCTLVLRYKNLIFSIPIRFGLSREEATDVFQSVCSGLISELPRLQESGGLSKWLLTVTSHACYHKKHKDEQVHDNANEINLWFHNAMPSEAREIVQKTEREQAVREAISKILPRDQEIIRKVFFEQSRRRFEEVAREIGPDTGSIGFSRQRVLGRIRSKLRGTNIS